MTGKYLIAAALVSACAVAASAQTTTEYYVVQDSATKKCTIVDKKPTTSTMVQVGPVAFKTRTEAEAGMKNDHGLQQQLTAIAGRESPAQPGFPFATPAPNAEEFQPSRTAL